MKSTPPDIPWAELIHELGEQAVLLDDASLALHSYDVWPVATKWRRQGKQPYRPDAVVCPKSAAQVSRIMQWAQRHRVPVTPWGLGSSVTGAPLPLRGGIVLDMSAMREILAFKERSLYVTAQAGILGSDLEKYLNERGYTLNHSPQSLYRSSIGGWVATRATGHFSSRWGGIEDLALGLQVVLPTGEVIETHLTPRAAVGPDLRHLFLGSEGTLGVITSVTLKIFPFPESQVFDTALFPSLESGVEALRLIARSGLRPFLARLYDPDETPHVMPGVKPGSCALFLGFEGPESVSQAEHLAALRIYTAQGGVPAGTESARDWMQRRFDFSRIESLLEQEGGLAETIEVAHFWDAILETYDALKNALRPHADQVLAHFSHIYPQGTSLYMILLGRAGGDEQAETRLMEVWETAMRVSLEKGAAISHHHGVGIARLLYIKEELGGSYLLLQKLKTALDPNGLMNPGKLGLE